MEELWMIESNLEFLKDYLAKCRKQHRKIKMETVKWYASQIYDIAEQKRRFDKKLPIGVVGRDFIDYHGKEN